MMVGVGEHLDAQRCVSLFAVAVYANVSIMVNTPCKEKSLISPAPVEFGKFHLVMLTPTIILIVKTID